MGDNPLQRNLNLTYLQIFFFLLLGQKLIDEKESKSKVKHYYQKMNVLVKDQTFIDMQ